jgi:hypothetical protein
MKRFAYSFVFAALAACGGGGTSVDIVGDTPEEAAAEIAEADCSRSVECGQATYECTTDPETQMLDCTGTIEEVTPAEEEECVAEIEENVLAVLSGCDLTDEEMGVIEDCVNAALAQPCISQSELDAWLAEIEAGNEPEPLRETPAVCDEADAIIEGCGPA